jgi:hypothetical protein
MTNTISGILSLATFPGVVVHQTLRLLFCKRKRLAVVDMCFLRMDNPAGFIAHEESADFGPAFSVGMGPLVIGSLLCLLACVPAYWPIRVLHIHHPLSYFFMWLGISIGMHAFPSREEAEDLFRHVGEQLVGLNLVVVFTLPLLPLIKLATRVSTVGVGLVYALVLGWGLPELVFFIVMKCVEPS